MDFLEEYEKSKWEEDWEEGRHFVTLNNGDNVGFDEGTEEYSLNNYWNVIGHDEANELIKEWGVKMNATYCEKCGVETGNKRLCNGCNQYD